MPTDITDIPPVRNLTFTSLQHVHLYPKQTLKISCVQDINEVENLWKIFNPNPQSIYQKWDYIKVFYDVYQYTPHFYTAFLNNTPVACIPLEWVEEK